MINSIMRKASTFRFDERVLEAVIKLAQKNNIGKNRFIENLLIKVCIEEGILPQDFEPLGETRGGKKHDK